MPLLFMVSHYPVILIPKSILQASSEVPESLPIYPVTPPISPGPKTAPIKPRNVASGSAIAAIPSIVTASTPEWRPYGVGFTLVALVAIALATTKRWLNLKTYTQKARQWNQETQVYQVEKRQFEEEAIAAFQLKLVLECLGRTVLPDGHNSRAKQGASEATFAQVLKSAFPGKIQTRRTLSIPDYRYPYTPDFVYWDEETQLHIDIEIDEPYDWRSRQPLHFVGCRKEQRRNQFFLNKGWLVIRFSEEQVMCWPDRCCQTIAEVIAQVLRRPLREDRGDSVPLRPRWTRDEAIEMEMTAIREKYSESA